MSARHIVVALAALATTMAQSADAPRSPAAVMAQAAPVKAAPLVVADKPAPEQQEIRAQLTPHRYTALAAEIGAKINRLPVQDGGRFKAGQLLIAFDCSLQQAQLNKAKAALTAADQSWAANKRLAELNSIGKVELNLSEAEVLKNRADVAYMQTMLGKCSISAPFSGCVTERKVQEQQYVQPGQAIMDIIDDSVLEIEFLVPSRWLAWVKPGTAFQVGQFSELIAGMSGRVALAPPANK
jgi:membrane fusion protein (multidrug efflux system)